MNAKKILSIVLVIALAACAAFAVVANNESAALKAQLDAANADMEANASAFAELQAQLDEANAKVAELEAAAAEAAANAETASADSANLQAQLDEANAKVAELEAAVEAAAADNSAAELQAQIDLYKPYYDKQVVIAYDGGTVMLDEVMEQYAQYEAAYVQYGIDLAAYGMDGQFKQKAAQTLLDQAVMSIKAAELGLDQIDEATMIGLTEEAAANYESYVASVESYFVSEDLTAEEVRAEAVEYLTSQGYTEEAILEEMINSYISDAIYNYITADIAVTDEDIQATYDAKVVEQMDLYSSDSSYNTDRNDGALILWNPEGYRAVKHVLVKFSDEQSASLKEMQTTLSELETELEAAQAPAEETEEASEETTEVRTVEQIEANIAAVEANIDALYAELLPVAQDVIIQFNSGVAFADLIAEYNEDPGMTNEPTASAGYAVSAASTTWDPAFRDGAMSIESVGGISEPVYGSYGIHVIYYESDIPAGAVALESVKAEVEALSLEDKISDTYNSTLDAWITALNPSYHYENIG